MRGVHSVLLDRGLRVVQMVRDPRDSIASLSYGVGSIHSGMPRPALFNVRQWRKSAAFALAFAGTDGFQCVRYEDLVAQPEATLATVASGIGLSGFDPTRWDTKVRAATGEEWLSNSSHWSTPYLNADSVGIHAGVLPGSVRRFIEACCFFEMQALGYEPRIDEKELPVILEAHLDEPQMKRIDSREYMWCPERASEEKRRLSAIARSEYEPQLFLFKRAFETIAARKAWRSN